jgi:hypothetical protein
MFQAVQIINRDTCMSQQEGLLRTGLTIFNPLEGNAVCKDLPRGHTSAYIYIFISKWERDCFN